MNPEALRNLPPVNALLDHPTLARALDSQGRARVLEAIRHTLDQARHQIRQGISQPITIDHLVPLILDRLANRRPHLRPVINATGVLLHTGLGRAPLAPQAIAAITRLVAGYCNLEFDLETGARGHRSTPIKTLLNQLTGCQSAAIVNNNAAATILALKALAAGHEVIVSRSQLVEIGGSFRLPEIFETSGAHLREVGTTNKTRLADYDRAITPDTAALLRVHASNFRIVGFTESVPIKPLADLAHERGLLAIDDIGSGALAPGLPTLLDAEPTVSESLAAGADVVLFSGDKLLGGPQCGLLVGNAEPLARIASDPLMRAFRVDKMTLAALEATLELALDPAHAATHIPLWSFLDTPLDSLAARADALATTFSQHHFHAHPRKTEALLGGGSAPAVPLPSYALAITTPLPNNLSLEDLARNLRTGDPAIVGRIQEAALLLDLRAIPPSLDSQLTQALRAATLVNPLPAR